MSISSEILNKAKLIRAIIFDVDGVLTDGGIIYDNSGLEYKRFNVKDGQIIKYLRQFEIMTGVITGRSSQVVRNRCEELKIDVHRHGISDKLATFDDLLLELGLNANEVAYIGDDINDLMVLKKCGLGATPNDGHFTVKEHADLILKSKGGQGALRELADLVLQAQGHYEQLIEGLIGNADL